MSSRALGWMAAWAACGLVALTAAASGATEDTGDPGRLAAAGVDLQPAEVLALGSVVCGAPLQPVADGGIGCRLCPPYTAEPGSAEGLVIRNLLRGRFSGSGRGEILLDTNGCEPHTADFGGALLLEATAGGWRRVWYQSGLRLDDCVEFSGRSHERLICNERFSGQGITVGDLSEIRVGRKAAERRRLLRWADNMDSDSRRLFSLKPESVETVDLNGDGRVDLRIHLRLVEARLPERYRDLEQATEAGYVLPEGSPEVLDFLQEPEGFVPAPTSLGRRSQLQELVGRMLE